jgi:hypothetical protein
MNQLKNIGSDLVEKKLWPLAVLLVAALVALPFVIGRGGADAVPPAPVAPATHVTAADGSQAEVTVQEVPAATAARNRAGKVRNPFAKEIKPPATAGASGAPTPPSSPSSPTPSAGAGGGSGNSGPASPTTPAPTGNGSPTTPAPKPDAKPKPDPLDTYRLRLAFGNTDHHSRLLDDVARLTPLPSAENPFFVFLGVLSDNQKAVFLVSSDATVTGDGTCKPNKATCETVELAAGETEYFDITTPGGRAVQYVMHVRKIERRPASDAGTARAAASRHSVAGQDLLRAAADAAVGPKSRAHAGMLRYRYLPKQGILVRARHGRAMRITAAGVEPQRRSAKHQPGVAVFRTRAKPPPAK